MVYCDDEGHGPANFGREGSSILGWSDDDGDDGDDDDDDDDDDEPKLDAAMEGSPRVVQ